MTLYTKFAIKMKYFTFLILLAVDVAYTQVAMPDFDKEYAQCVTELKLDGSKIKKMPDFGGEITHDEKCVIRCVLQKVGAIDKNGAVIEDEVDKQFSKENNINFSTCTPPSSVTDPCEQTYVTAGCIVNLLGSV